MLIELDGKINQLIDSEDTATTPASNTTIVLDNSRHIHQSGGVNLHSEGDINIGGDVVGGDKISGTVKT